MLWWWGDPWGAGRWIGIGFMTVFWIAVIVGLVFLIRHAASRSAASSKPSSDGERSVPSGDRQASVVDTGSSSGDAMGQVSNDALRILEERYARGEIDREAFLQMKADLGG